MDEFPRLLATVSEQHKDLEKKVSALEQDMAGGFRRMTAARMSTVEGQVDLLRSAMRHERAISRRSEFCSTPAPVPRVEITMVRR